MMSAPAARYCSWISVTTSGRVRISRSLLPRRSFEWSLNRSPRKSASPSVWRWIIVPIAPSRRRMRVASARSRALTRGCRVRNAGCRLSGMSRVGLSSTGNEHREGVALAAGADRHPYIGQSGLLQQLRQLVVFEAEPRVAETLADPALFVTPEIEYKD